LSTVKLRDAAIRDCTFDQCRALGVDWSGTSLVFTPTFRDCNLSYATFCDLTLRSVTFRDCNLTEATFERVDLRGARFSDTLLAGAAFARCDLRQADLSTARDLALDLTGNRCRGAVISVEAAIGIAAAAGLVVR